MKTSSLASIVAACLSAGGAMAGYIFLKPRSLEKYLEWQGLKLASITEDNLWKSIYDENKDNFNSDFSSTETDQWKVIKDYCTKAFKKTDYSSDIEKATKWCVDNVRTVRGQLIRQGKNVNDLMTEVDQFKTAAVVQGNENFWKLIGVDGKDLNDRANVYQTWCDSSLKEKPKDDLVGNVDTFCRKKPYSNFKDKLTHDGYVRLNDEEIKKKYDELKVEQLRENTGSNILEAIGGGPQNWIPNLGITKGNWKIERKKFEEQYKSYCGSGDVKKLFEKDGYPSKYSEYRGICSRPINPKK
ncbi:hypothetical protein A6V39_01235 [Candidatus Mycoplasma haematobovis]|uniref:Uncharacterized protein n=1 Tax=Candidatus Mycoplasma haematobovis TaxID=432608 RepID=A0A1A9QDX6_9MOLU|nr:hypothetical protein [Candidatus Mycoplasma haematobovis]OAL10677.1 hypothetical protein A6V39_01235 [Candidatus Mycoplasma haematobovis]